MGSAEYMGSAGMLDGPLAGGVLPIPGELVLWSSGMGKSRPTPTGRSRDGWQRGTSWGVDLEQSL